MEHLIRLKKAEEMARDRHMALGMRSAYNLSAEERATLSVECDIAYQNWLKADRAYRDALRIRETA